MMNEIDYSTEHYTEHMSTLVSDTQSFKSFKGVSLAPHNFSILSTSSIFNGTDANTTNATLTLDDWRHAYKPILDYMMLTILIAIMLSIGCEIKWKNLLYHIKRPFGLCIGLFSQFLFLPLSAYCILRFSGIRGLQATGVLIISCCPGGAMSNVFTYFCEGDLPLSVAMTCVSTLLAMGMMPLNLWMYGRYFESDDLVIPYKNMAISVISITSPVLVGMLVKWKFPRLSTFVTKIGGYCGLVIAFASVGVGIVLYPNMFNKVSAEVYAVILTLPILGLSLGYGLAYLLKQAPSLRKTIAIECGIQNVPLALTIVYISFPIEMQENIILIPSLYSFSMIIGCSILCLAYHFLKKYTLKNKQKQEAEIALKEVPLLEDGKNFVYKPKNGSQTLLPKIISS